MGFLGIKLPSLGTIAGAAVGFVGGGPAGAIAGARFGSRLQQSFGGRTIAPPMFPLQGTAREGGIQTPMGGAVGRSVVCPPGMSPRVTKRLFGPDVTDCVSSGQTPGIKQTNGQGFGGCACGTFNGRCSCCLPGGGMGRTNKTRYFRKVDRCADPSNPGNYQLVQPGERCVSRRGMNSANPKAAKRALRRLEGFHRTLKRTEKALKKLAR